MELPETPACVDLSPLERLRVLATAAQRFIDENGHAADNAIFWDFDAAANPETILALLPVIEAASRVAEAIGAGHSDACLGDTDCDCGAVELVALRDALSRLEQ